MSTDRDAYYHLTYPLVQNPRWDNVSGIIIGSLCVIGVALTTISAVLVVYFRDNIVIKASRYIRENPPFLLFPRKIKF